MSESLGDLLRRSADAAPAPHMDVGALVVQADRRQRRRRLGVIATAAALVAVVVGGTFALRNDQTREPDPAPSPAPSPTVVDPNPDPGPQSSSTRPLVYAAGRTVHMGDETFEANRPVAFLDATDDGVVYQAEDNDTVWFSDGSTAVAIGRSPTDHIGMFEVSTANPGSLVVWPDATSLTNGWIDQFVVYDTSRRELVARLPFTGHYNSVVYVDEAHVFFNPDSGAPGCWVIDIHYCNDPHLFRYDLASGETRRITQASLEDELRTQVRMLVLAEPRGEGGTRFTARGMARFNQVGRQLVPVDSNGDVTVFSRTTGERIRLRLPAGYAASGDEMPVVQWLDDDRLVLFPNQGRSDFPPEVGELLECGLPDGVCRVAVRASSTRYVAPG